MLPQEEELVPKGAQECRGVVAAALLTLLMEILLC